MVRRLVKLLQSDQLPVATTEDRSAYSAAAKGSTDTPAKAETASLSNPGQAGRTENASGASRILERQPLGTHHHASGDESLSQQLVHQSERAEDTIRPENGALV